MDWTLAIDRNRDALLRMLAAMLVMAGGGAVVVMPRHVRTEIWRVLRPAESALRRLIVVVQYVLAIEARITAVRVAPAIAAKSPHEGGGRVPVFALFDTRKHPRCGPAPRYTKTEPNIRYFDDVEIFPPKVIALPDDPVSAERLTRRLQAVQRALEDLPKQARRLARWQGKRAQAVAGSGVYIRPMWPGRPPGHRARRTHPVDDILSNCHDLALYVLHPPDTSSKSARFDFSGHSPPVFTDGGRFVVPDRQPKGNRPRGGCGRPGGR